MVFFTNNGKTSSYNDGVFVVEGSEIADPRNPKDLYVEFPYITEYAKRVFSMRGFRLRADGCAVHASASVLERFAHEISDAEHEACLLASEKHLRLPPLVRKSIVFAKRFVSAMYDKGLPVVVVKETGEMGVSLRHITAMSKSVIYVGRWPYTVKDGKVRPLNSKSPIFHFFYAEDCHEPGEGNQRKTRAPQASKSSHRATISEV